MSSKILKEEFDKLRQDLIIAYDAKGMRASGNFADSLDVIIGDTYAELWGDEYAEQLEYGRNAGGFPPLKDIEDWITAKGVFNDVLQEIKLSSLAYIIARKIAEQAWNRANYGGVGLISEVITEERLQMIINLFGENELITFTSDLIDIFNELESNNGN